jgi:hypothetical protein
MIMLTCKTEGCAMGDEQHTPHPDGIPVICCFCSQELTPND